MYNSNDKTQIPITGKVNNVKYTRFYSHKSFVLDNNIDFPKAKGSSPVYAWSEHRTWRTDELIKGGIFIWFLKAEKWHHLIN